MWSTPSFVCKQEKKTPDAWCSNDSVVTSKRIGIRKSVRSEKKPHLKDPNSFFCPGMGLVKRFFKGVTCVQDRRSTNIFSRVMHCLKVNTLVSLFKNILHSVKYVHSKASWDTPGHLATKLANFKLTTQTAITFIKRIYFRFRSFHGNVNSIYGINDIREIEYTGKAQ